MSADELDVQLSVTIYASLDEDVRRERAMPRTAGSSFPRTGGGGDGGSPLFLILRVTHHPSVKVCAQI